MPRKPQKWIQVEVPKPGALRRQLGIPMSKRIPHDLERQIVEAKVGNKVLGHKVTPLMKKRVNFAINMRKR
jgi:hypothetical protein